MGRLVHCLKEPTAARRTDTLACKELSGVVRRVQRHRHASANSRSDSPHTLGLPKADQLAPSRDGSKGGSLVSAAAKDAGVSSRAASLDVAKKT